MSKEKSSRFKTIVSKITNSANKAVKTKESFKAFRQQSLKKYSEVPNLQSINARMV